MLEKTCEHLAQIKPEYRWIAINETEEQLVSQNICGICNCYRILRKEKRKIKW